MYTPTRLKVQLKLAINRLKMLQAKKQSLNQHQRREIATLLEQGKEESARIRVEHIIREDLLMEAMEILELYCDLILARFGLIEQYRECDEGILEAVQTLLWATPRAEQVKELVLIRDQLAFRYGKEFVLEAMENKSSHVNARVIAKMQVNAPDIYLVEGYLEEIARTYDIEWVSNVLSQEQSSDESDVDGNTAVVTPLQKSMAQSSSPDLDLPDIPINLLLAGVSKPKEEKEKRGSFDDLAKRLEALKKR